MGFPLTMKRLTLILSLTAAVLILSIWADGMSVFIWGSWYPADLIRFHIWPWVLVIFWSVVGLTVGKSLGIEDDLTAGAVGVGLVAVGSFLLGLAGGLFGPLVYSLGIAAAVWGYDHLPGVWKRLKDSISGKGFPFYLMMAVVVWYIWRTLPLVTLPAVGWDENNSHLVLPELYVRDRAVLFYPWVNFSNFPQLVEMLVTLQRFVTSTPGACWQYLSHMLTLVMIYRLTVTLTGVHVVEPGASWREIFRGPMDSGSYGPCIAVLLYLAIPVTTMYSQMVLTDPVLVFYCGLLLLRILEGAGAVEVGLISGLVLSIKYTGIPWVGLCWAVWIILNLKTKLKNGVRG